MWLIFALATTFLWALAELFYKKGAHPDEKYSHLKICVCVGFTMGLHAIFTLLTQNIHYNPVNIIKYFPVSALYIISMACSFFGMRFIEESISDPIENTSGALCTLLCVIFLGKRLTLLEVCAIGIILTGIIGISYLESKDDKGKRKKFGKRLAVIAFLMPFLYAILDAFASFLDIYYLEDIAVSPFVDVTDVNIEMVANTTYEITFAICAICLFLYMKSKRVIFNFFEQEDKVLAAICETAGQFTYVYAMRGNGVIAAPIISSVCVISLLLARHILKEKITKTQYIFIALVIIGIMVIAIYDV